ncbi:hypothetical protein V6Z96_005179 [Aspergillus fumigatus]
MKLSRFSTPRLQSRCEAMEEGYRLFLSSLALLVDPILLAFLDYPPDVYLVFVPAAHQKKKRPPTFLPLHTTLLYSVVSSSSLYLFERAKTEGNQTEGKKRGKGIINIIRIVG